MQSDHVVEQIVGKQPMGDSKYRMMKYVITSEFEGKLLAYNSVTAQLIALNSSEKAILKENVIDDEKVLLYLVNEYFLVPEDFDDSKFYENVFSTKRFLLKEKGINFYKILTTNDCNARCFYCYKLDAEHISMTKETTKQICNYIIKNHSEKVHLYWFGGEPLMNIEPIKDICESLQKNSIDYKSSIITNGYLLNDELINLAIKDWHLEFVQITLDGTEKVHNRIKAFIYGKHVNPFAVILDNIEKILKTGVRLLVRLNMDFHNKEDLYELVKVLKNRFSVYENFKIYSALLFEDNSNRRIKRKFDIRSALVDEYLKFCDYLKEEQVIAYKRLPNKMKINCCMADSDSSVVVLPDGRLAKCDLDAEGSVFGHISNDEQDREVIANWKVLREQSGKCGSCAMRPLCIEVKGCKERLLLCDELEEKMKLYAFRSSMIDVYKRSTTEN